MKNTARHTAYQALLQMEENEGYSNIVIDKALGAAGQSLLFNEDSTFRTDFARTDRDSWRDSVLAALVPAGDTESES